MIGRVAFSAKLSFRRFSSMFARDALLAWRNGQLAVTLAIMGIMILLVVLLPAQIRTKPNEIILDLMEGKPLYRAALASGANMEAFAADDQELAKRLAGSGTAIGIVARENDIGGAAFELRAGADMPDSALALLEASLDELLRIADGRPSAERFPVESLEPAPRPIALNLKGIPVFLIFEAGILGFLLVAVFIFQEKQEGTIRAYRASPAGALAYAGSKTLVFVLLSVLYGAGVIAAGTVMGARPNLAGTLLTLAGASAAITLGGLGFACYFSNLSGWFFPGLGLLLLNILPFFSYANPAFSPWWMNLIPSYPYLRLTESYFFNPAATPSPTLLWPALAWLAALAAFALVSVKAKLLKEGA
jgi:ABC-2 type transport system permease protein/fluoroquinolone transport system permease protein